MIKKLFIIMMFLIPLWTECSVRVRHEYDKKTDFMKYSTYTWINDKGINRKVEVSRLIETAIAGQLAEKGYQKASGEEPNFGIMYYGGVKGRVDVIDYDFSAWMNEYGDQDSKNRGHEEATLVIEIVDLKTRVMVWRGWAGIFLDNSASTEDIVNNVVGKILEKFPPR